VGFSPICEIIIADSKVAKAVKSYPFMLESSRF